MFETVRRHPLKVLTHVAQDPFDAFTAFQEEFLSRFESKDPVRYPADPNWDAGMREAMGIAPDFARAEFATLWDEVIGELRERGMKVGPGSFHAWNDGDAGFVRAIWTLIRFMRPTTVVETGVAHGMTSRFILEGLERNGEGRLWSIDLPPINPVTRQEVGVAVATETLRRRWTYIAGTSRRRLPVLLDRLGQVDLFIHDSMHSGRNVAFEMETAWPRLRAGGAMVVDDIDLNPSFGRFVERHPEHPSFVCTAEPVTPDLRRFNQKGLFGIVLKAPLRLEH
ncbi:MAG: class I SAM-dependent methyltransferase [Rhodospirillales bacterium]|nr:class I SAM-dependent methyltransferase [Rhodospirillales bacterium]